MIVTLKSYLDTLEELERLKPERDRRKVPTLTELAAAAGIHKGSMSRIVNGQVRYLSFEVGSAILDELNRRGFSSDITDIVSYHPAVEEKEPA